MSGGYDALPLLVVLLGAALVIFRKDAAKLAVGRRAWPLRSFEFPMMLVGLLWLPFHDRRIVDLGRAIGGGSTMRA